MSSRWLAAAAVTVAMHGVAIAWIAGREVAPPPPRPVTRFEAWMPEPAPEPEPEPPPPPRPRLVHRARPRPAQAPADPPPAGATRTEALDPPSSGLEAGASAASGTLSVQGGHGILGALVKGAGEARLPPPPPPKPRPTRHFVPIFEVTRLPRVLRPVQPAVPGSFRDAHREAVVVIEVSISARGAVLDARVVKRAGFGLEQAALEAARKTRCSPALVEDRPVAVRMQIPYRFKVRG